MLVLNSRSIHIIIISSILTIHFFFFNDTATTEIYTLSLHDALPISGDPGHPAAGLGADHHRGGPPAEDRKSTRLNSSHQIISYAVFCLKKKKKSRYSNHHQISYNTHNPDQSNQTDTVARTHA